MKVAKFLSWHKPVHCNAVYDIYESGVQCGDTGVVSLFFHVRNCITVRLFCLLRLTIQRWFGLQGFNYWSLCGVCCWIPSPPSTLIPSPAPLSTVTTSPLPGTSLVAQLQLSESKSVKTHCEQHIEWTFVPPKNYIQTYFLLCKRQKC